MYKLLKKTRFYLMNKAEVRERMNDERKRGYKSFIHNESDVILCQALNGLKSAMELLL